MVPIAYRERERIFGVMTPPARTFVQADWRSRESATEVRLNGYCSSVRRVTWRSTHKTATIIARMNAPLSKKMTIWNSTGATATAVITPSAAINATMKKLKTALPFQRRLNYLPSMLRCGIELL